TVGIAPLARVQICNRRAKRTVARRDADRSGFHACEQLGSRRRSSSSTLLITGQLSQRPLNVSRSCLPSTAPAIQTIPYAVTSIVDGGGLMETW
ncbi:hypothetical protein K402DRAFT_389131, partial [Aulographum hederae CBS 113979]